jgi:predicted TIM-barrel enzyme
VISVYVPRLEEESQGWKAAGSMEQAMETARKICAAAIKADPEAIILCSGGTFETADDVKKCLDATGAYGYIGDEWIECRRIEESVAQAVSGYRALRLR